MGMEKEKYSFDEKDAEILRALQKNARLTNKELASIVHLSTTPTYERVKRLERLGYIQQYTTILDANKLNKGFTVFCSVKLRQLNAERANAFTNMIREIPEVTECYNISGGFDYLLRIQSPDMKYYQQFLLKVIGKHENIASLESTFVMEEIKHEYGVSV
ncbi:MAG: Lrp/AsnC family transcriptional regulator [Bacteroidales bacterium]|nr:Lrp/AsnC family transcriptional regulator [Bacteroidales bacterium]MBP5589908.1 Lrp/AsnC family transcriptional regulator [Bacteroidales bacterium]MBP5708782.1 Lrp/AsnC family transcriptional regulator [Bacteroidales bacterium]